jgi:hypothetical protein
MKLATTCGMALVSIVATLTFGLGSEAHSVVDKVDHAATGFPLDGRHQEIRCDGCHRISQFAATPRRCADCHNNVFAEGRTFLHIPVTASCDRCHTTRDWLTSRLDHTGIYNRCISCHNNFQAPGKNARHPATDNICERCHITTHWNQLLPGARSTAWRPLAAPTRRAAS